MRRVVIPSLFMLLALLSCNRSEQKGRDTIELVKAIAADSGSPEHKLLASFSRVPSSGDIYIIGGPESCKLVQDAFQACDVQENARGRNWSDGLKDFAGETFACISDGVYTPYAAMIQNAGDESLRELAVNYALAALSPQCSVSIYDLDGNHEKTSAKILILADPWLLDKAKFDIDTLFTLTGCKVPVISPQALMLDAALGGEKKYFNTGIICDSLYLHSGIYQTLFNAKSRDCDIMGAHCFTAGKKSGPFLAAFLDEYTLAGNSAPLDALMVDDWSVDVESIMSEIQAIRDYNREEYMRYGKLLAPDFTVFSSSSITMSACYSLLRSQNLFTHKIAQPAASSYVVKPRPNGSGQQFLLIPSENVQD